MLLREPADRAHSQFLMRMRLGSRHVREGTHFRSWALGEAGSVRAGIVLSDALTLHALLNRGTSFQSLQELTPAFFTHNHSLRPLSIGSPTSPCGTRKRRPCPCSSLPRTPFTRDFTRCVTPCNAPGTQQELRSPGSCAL